MKISIIHPSRGRADQAFETYKKWMINCDSTSHIEYIISIDRNDAQYWEYITFFAGEKIYQNLGTSAIQAINGAAKMATGDIFIVVSDDTDCPEHWDTELEQQLGPEGHYTDFCVKTDDGLQPTLITMPIMDRIYYERYGYIYHPDYLHMFADQELTAVAMMTGKYIKLDLSFPHLHYTTGKTAKDEINVRNDRTWGQGQRLFDKHLETNFGIESPVMPYSEIKWK